MVSLVQEEFCWEQVRDYSIEWFSYMGDKPFFIVYYRFYISWPHIEELKKKLN